MFGYPWLPWLCALALVGLTVLMLFDPSARNQVIAVLILTVGLIVAFFVLPGTRQRADSQ